jgi:polyisoprenoid-binding protein YceI
MDLSAFAGLWVLDADQTSIVVHTKALWVVPVKATAKAIEGRGTLTDEGDLSGTLVVDAASIDTKNRKRPTSASQVRASSCPPKYISTAATGASR